jgi:ArsR family transcriptional regulator
VDAARKLKALGHPVRLGIALRLAAEGGTCACDFAEIFSISQPAVSQHLKVLWQAGLVQTRRDGTKIYYSLDPAGVRALQEEVGRLAPGGREGTRVSRSRRSQLGARSDSATSRPFTSPNGLPVRRLAAAPDTKS